MMTEEDFSAPINELISRGYTRDRAEQLVFALGDIIEEDNDGLWVIRDEKGFVMDRIKPLKSL